MGGESTAAWSSFLGDLDKRGLNRPEFVIVAPEARVPRDGAPGLKAALAQFWGDDLPIQRCTVHKHRNLLAYAPKHLHEEIGAELSRHDLRVANVALTIGAPSATGAGGGQAVPRLASRKWRLKCRAVADSLEEAGDRLFTFTRLDPVQWKAARTTNAIERLNEEFRRRIKTQTVLPCAETVPMLLWALLASGQITMRKIDGWQTLDKPIGRCQQSVLVRSLFLRASEVC